MEAFSNKQSFAKKIDDYFKNKKQNEQNIIYMMVALIIAYLVYQFVFSQTNMMRNEAYDKMISIKSKVENKRSYLRVNTIARFQQMKNILQQRVNDYDNTLYKISYVDNTLSELSYLLFNDENWAKFVDNIAFLAKEYGLEIEKITNKFYKPTFQKVSQVVSIEIKAKSNYQNMMKFLNKIEESKLVVDVTDMNISKPGEKLSSYFKISVWGMKY